ncbi:MAG: ribonuclease Z [Clostridia bacterium]|nr:ribonuclease Z [Clostridia bacterium]
MRVIVCVDDNNGMLFNKRRQSRDSVVNRKIKELAEGKRLLMSAYSAKMFGDCDKIEVESDIFAAASNGDFCFAEEKIETLEGVEALYVFCWNRSYPADVYFQFKPENEGFCAVFEEELEGSSHEKITLTVFERK